MQDGGMLSARQMLHVKRSFY